MFVNAVEDFGLEEYERPNWINFVRQPIERIQSSYYFGQKCHPNDMNPNEFLVQLEQTIASNFTRPKRSIKKVCTCKQHCFVWHLWLVL